MLLAQVDIRQQFALNNSTAVYQVYGSPADLINKFLPYVFTFAGLIMLVLIVASGLSIISSAGDPKGIENAKKRMTTAAIGFILIVTAYWLIQLLEFALLKTSILNSGL